MSLVTTLILAIIGSTGISSIVVAILQHHWTKKAKNDERIDALVFAQKVIMMDRIKHLGRSYIVTGTIEMDEKAGIKSMYGAYKALDGNGTPDGDGSLETIMEEIDNLKVVG